MLSGIESLAYINIHQSQNLVGRKGKRPYENLPWLVMEKACICIIHTVYVPIDAHCASADLRVRVYLKKKIKKN